VVRVKTNFTSGKSLFHTWGIICYDLYPLLLFTQTRELFIMKTNMKHEKNIINIWTKYSSYIEESEKMESRAWVEGGIWKGSRNISKLCIERGSICGVFFCFSEMTGIIQFGHRINSNLYMFYFCRVERGEHETFLPEKVKQDWRRAAAVHVFSMEYFA
jgi:hypothetical protein